MTSESLAFLFNLDMPQSRKRFCHRRKEWTLQVALANNGLNARRISSKSSPTRRAPQLLGQQSVALGRRIQGDQSGCSLDYVDIKAEVAFLCMALNL